MTSAKISQTPVVKTIKLFIGGDFPRTESGRTYPVNFAKTKNVFAHLCLSSRKDFRNAVTAAQSAQESWASKSAYNRAQILYRMAEMMEGKTAEFQEILMQVFGMTAKNADQEIDLSIDALVYYAGWADKYQQVIGSVNPVSGPHHNFTSPEPTGVVASVFEEQSPLSRLLASLAATLCSGNAIVAFLPGRLGALISLLGEVIATSDVPKATVNLLSGDLNELKSQIGSHMEVQAICFEFEDGKENNLIFQELQKLGSENMKRIFRGHKELQTLERVLDFVEYKTVWHPIGH